jgi:hypothetical protein
MTPVNDGGGYYVLFGDEHERWHELRTYLDGRRPWFRHYNGQIMIDTFVLVVPSQAVELNAGDFRIHWQDGKVVGVPYSRKK